jgi:hypothetical protein
MHENSSQRSYSRGFSREWLSASSCELGLLAMVAEVFTHLPPQYPEPTVHAVVWQPTLKFVERSSRDYVC